MGYHTRGTPGLAEGTLGALPTPAGASFRMSADTGEEDRREAGRGLVAAWSWAGWGTRGEDSWVQGFFWG